MKFIRKYLRATDLATDRQSVKKFVHKFLGYDGVCYDFRNTSLTRCI